jgi:hypothetical protein
MALETLLSDRRDRRLPECLRRRTAEEKNKAKRTCSSSIGAGEELTKWKNQTFDRWITNQTIVTFFSVHSILLRRGISRIGR